MITPEAWQLHLASPWSSSQDHYRHISDPTVCVCCVMWPFQMHCAQRHYFTSVTMMALSSSPWSSTIFFPWAALITSFSYVPQRSIKKVPLTHQSHKYLQRSDMLLELRRQLAYSCFLLTHNVFFLLKRWLSIFNTPYQIVIAKTQVPAEKWHVSEVEKTAHLFLLPSHT